MFKSIVLSLLRHYAKKYLATHKPTLVVVTGSVGKTGTKQAIATVLGEKFRVRAQDGNHNTDFSVPVAIMGVEYPDNPKSVGQWREVFAAMRRRISEQKDVDVIVQELGTDRPGDIARFAYLKPEIAVVTAVSEEHMENFATLEDVAREELSVARFSKLTVVGRDDVDEAYAKFAETHTIDTYGTGNKAEYRLVVEPANPLEGRIARFSTPEWGELTVSLQLIGDHTLKVAAAAGCVGAKLGLTSTQIAKGISRIKPIPGRMRPLRGVNESTILDDTYNASPLAVTEAIRTLYAIEATQRIAVLGSMNELGQLSAQAHEKIGKLCDPTKLEWVVTIGEEAQRYLAPAALNNGCQVKSFQSPYLAGGFVHSVLKPKAVVLVKGSQDGVFAEEAVKVLLHSTEDEQRLVRQTPYWLERKDTLFDKPLPED